MWRVTHVDLRGRRHQMELACETNAAALAIAEAAFGPAQYLAAVRLRTQP